MVSVISVAANISYPKGYVDEAAHTSKDIQFPVDAIEIIPSSDHSINSDGTNPPDVEHSKSTEAKSEKSVIQYAKMKAFEKTSATGDRELLWKSVQSVSDELGAQSSANQIATIYPVSDEKQTSNVDTNKGKVADASVAGDILEKDNNFVALQEANVSIVNKHDVSIRLSAPKPINNPAGGHEITATSETKENPVQTWEPHEIGIVTVAGATSPSTKAILMDSLGQNCHTPNRETSSHQKMLDNHDLTIQIKRTEVRQKVHTSSIYTESSNSTRLVNLEAEQKFNGLLSHGEGKRVETGDVAEADSLEADISKQKIEYIDLKEPSSSLDMMTLKTMSHDFESEDLVRVQKHASMNEIISSASTTEVVEDIVKVIQQQTTHDLLCPVCGSCITKRVILRKRKRTSIASLEKWHKKEIEEDSPATESTERIDAASTETSTEQITDLFENEEDEEWGCLACLTFFFRRARGVRRGSSNRLQVIKRAEEGLVTAESDSNQLAHFNMGEYVRGTSEQRVNCIPLLFPTFPWASSQNLRKMGTELTEQLVQKEDQGCLAFVFPEYPWRIGRDGEPSIVDEVNNDNTIITSGNTELQKDRNEIENIENEEIQTNISVTIPSAPEAEPEAVREAKDDNVGNPLSFTFWEYPSGSGENADNGTKAEVTEELEEHYAVQGEDVVEDMRTKTAASKPLLEGNCCFTFLLPDIHRPTKVSIPNLDTSKEAEHAAISALEWQTDTQIREHETFEVNEFKIGDIAVKKPIISDIESLHITKQKEEFHNGSLPRGDIGCLFQISTQLPGSLEVKEQLVSEGKLKQESMNLQKNKSMVQSDDMPSEIVESDPTARELTTEEAVYELSEGNIESSKENIGCNCLPEILPEFKWGPNGVYNEAIFESENLPSISIQGPEKDQIEENAKSASKDSGKIISRLDDPQARCLPFLFPQFPWEIGIIIGEGGVQTQQFTRKEDQDFPEFTLEVEKKDELMAAARDKQDNTGPVSGSTELQTNKIGIERFEEDEIQMKTASANPSTAELEIKTVREAKEENVGGCLLFAFPDYPWDTEKMTGAAFISDQKEKEATVQVETTTETQWIKRLTSEHLFKNKNDCFSFLLPDRHTETESSSPKLDNKGPEDAYVELHSDIKKEKHFERTAYSETKEHKDQDFLITEPVVSEIQSFQALKQNEDVGQKLQENVSNAPYRIQEPSRKGKNIMQEVDAPAELTEVHRWKIKNEFVGSADTVQDLAVLEALQFSSKEDSSSSTPGALVKADPAATKLSINEENFEEEILKQAEDSTKHFDDSGKLVKYDSASEKTPIDAAKSDFSTEKVGCNCLPAIVPQFPWASKQYYEPTVVTEHIPGVLTQDSVKDQTDDKVGLDPREPGKNSARLEEAPARCLPILFPKFPWQHEITVEQDEAIKIPLVHEPNWDPEETTDKTNLESTPLLFPTSPIDQHVVKKIPAEGYVTKETRIEAKITSTTSYVSAKTAQPPAKGLQIQSVKLDESVAFLDAVIKSSDPQVAVKIYEHEAPKVKPEPSLTTRASTGYALLDFDNTKNKPLASKPSTGYAMLEALDIDSDIDTSDEQVRPEKKINQKIFNEDKADDQRPATGLTVSEALVTPAKETNEKVVAEDTSMDHTYAAESVTARPSTEVAVSVALSVELEKEIKKLSTDDGKARQEKGINEVVAEPPAQYQTFAAAEEMHEPAAISWISSSIKTGLHDDDQARPGKVINEVVTEAIVQHQICAAEEQKHKPVADKKAICECFSLPEISWLWPSIQKRHYDIEQPLLGEQDKIDDNLHQPIAQSIAAVSTESVIEVQPAAGVSPAGAVRITVESGVIQPRSSDAQRAPDYLKSIVYGGLDVTLASLGVVSAAAGGEAKTITVLALSLANLVAGFLTFAQNTWRLHHLDPSSFEEIVGRSLWKNGCLAALSFIIFGLVAPITYAFSFRSSNDSDYKFVATALISLICLALLGLGKARVRHHSYVATVLSLITTGFVASTAAYFVGDFVARWLKKFGFDYTEPARAPTSAPKSGSDI